MVSVDKMITNAIIMGITKAAYDIEAHAVRIVPVDTGRLRASIKVRLEGSTITIGADTDYAEFIEFGTHKMRAQPYIRPAIHAGIKKYIPQRVLNELRKVKHGNA